MNLKKLLNISFILISVTFFIILLFEININNLATFYNKISIGIWILIFLGFLMSYIMKTLRFMMLNTISFKEMFSATIYQNFFLLILPFRLGELAYIKKLNKLGIKKIKSASDIIIVRIYDALILSLLSFLVILSLNNQNLGKSLIIPIILIITSLFFLIYLDRLIKLLRLLFKDSFLKEKMEELSNIFSKVNLMLKVKLLFISILVWFFAFIPWLIILTKIFNLTLFQMLLIITITVAFTFIPINPPAGVGIINGAWITGLVLVGTDLSLAINYSLFAHAIYIIQIVLIFIIVFAYSSLKQLFYH